MHTSVGVGVGLCATTCETSYTCLLSNSCTVHYELTGSVTSVQLIFRGMRLNGIVYAKSLDAARSERKDSERLRDYVSVVAVGLLGVLRMELRSLCGLEEPLHR